MLRSIHRRTASALLAAILGGILLVPGGAASVVPTRPIQPGARINSPYGCTMNFIYRDGLGQLYVGTAGHCTNRVGGWITDEGGRHVGRVVYRIDKMTTTDDFALVRIHKSRYPDVSPAVRHWGGPTGWTRSWMTTTDDEVLLSGYGMGFDISATTRPRPGLLTIDDSFEYRAAAPAIFGDSGGPLLHGRTGRALGIVVGLPRVPTGTVAGITIEHFLSRMRRAGFRLTLMTASYDDGFLG